MQTYQVVYVTKIYSTATVEAINKIEAEKMATVLMDSGVVNTLSESDTDIDIESVREVNKQEIN